MSAVAAPQPTSPGSQPPDGAWYRLEADAVASILDVDPAAGLPAAQVDARLRQYGPNRLSEKEKEPGWQAFLRQYRDLMQIVLLVAAIVNQPNRVTGRASGARLQATGERRLARDGGAEFASTQRGCGSRRRHTSASMPQEGPEGDDVD